jgi:hypothetical protein
MNAIALYIICKTYDLTFGATTSGLSESVADERRAERSEAMKWLEHISRKKSRVSVHDVSVIVARPKCSTCPDQMPSLSIEAYLSASRDTDVSKEEMTRRRRWFSTNVYLDSKQLS